MLKNVKNMPVQVNPNIKFIEISATKGRWNARMDRLAYLAKYK